MRLNTSIWANLTLRWSMMIAVLALIAACQTVDSNGRVQYNAFYSPADHMQDFLKEGDAVAAIGVYEAEQAYFNDPGNEDAPPAMEAAAQAMVTSLGDKPGTAIQKLRALNWPVDQSQWGEVKSVLTEANAVIETLPETDLFQKIETKFSQIEELKAALSDAKSRIVADAPKLFAEYNLSGPAFHTIYPTTFNTQRIFSAGFDNRVNDLSALPLETMATVLKQYPAPDVLTQSSYDRIAKAYISRVEEDIRVQESDPIKVALRTLSYLEKADIAMPDSMQLEIGFAEATSKSLLAGGAIEFPPEIEIDLPIKVLSTDLESALLDPASPDTIIVFQVALAKASRRIENMVPKNSRFIAGYKQEVNPAYQQAQIKMNQAQIAVSSAQSQMSSAQFQTGLAAAFAQLAAAISVAAAQEEFQGAVQEFQETPQFVDKPVYQNYQYKEGKVKSKKVMTINYYIINRKSGSYFKSIVDVAENEEFTIPYNLNPEDVKFKTIVTELNSEQTVRQWETAGSSIPLSAILSHYAEQTEGVQKYKSASELYEVMAKEKTRILASYTEQQYDARPLNDPRFDHVVAIYTSNSLGSGFFVRPDVVMTNFHVVDETEFVELKMYDGTETFGKVIARDARLDLALVKVQSRGKPVKFMEGRDLLPGDQVEAIGHPRGLEFSITRGVVSAIRKHQSIIAQGGDDVLFVQTDTDINPGNSGGPLFKGDLVVGINDFKLVRETDSGLNFSIHYSEAIRYMNEILGAGS